MPSFKHLTKDFIEVCVPDETSLTWQRMNDPRILASGGYALVMQVAHPTVGQGVIDHSDYQARPWNRLWTSIQFIYEMSYGGPDVAWDCVQRLIQSHKSINGIHDGKKYSAFEPEAWNWVHASIYDASMLAHDHFTRGLDEWEKAKLLEEWNGVGEAIGIGHEEMAWTTSDFAAYKKAMIDKLEYNDTVQQVLDFLLAVSGPSYIPKVIWQAGWGQIGKVLWTSTCGLLEPEMREKLYIEWTNEDQKRFNKLSKISRSLQFTMPVVSRIYSPRNSLRMMNLFATT